MDMYDVMYVMSHLTDMMFKLALLYYVYKYIEIRRIKE